MKSNLRYIILYIIAFGVLAGAVFSVEMGITKIFNYKVSILIPKNMKRMTKKMMEIKYPAQNRPTLVFTNESGSINVAFNHTTTKLQQKDIESLTEYMEQTFLQAYSDAKILDKGVKVIHDRKVGFIEVITPASDTEIYNLIFFTNFKGTMLLSTFNCTVAEAKDWQRTAYKIRESLKIND
ncbi:MAG: hypothetical protein ABUK01_01020 [Leptospirales bacterium]